MNIADLYLTTYQDWQDHACVLDVIVVLHVEIGELSKGIRTHRQILKARLFFYNSKYCPPKDGRPYKLTPLPLLALDDPSWPIPDMLTSEGFRDRLFADFQKAMKPNTGDQGNALKWYMPFHYMVDLFSIQSQGNMC